jgi:hypothetical protein
MVIRIPAHEIHDAWPRGLHALFLKHGVKLVDTKPPHTPESIRFAEPCIYQWDVETGDLVIEQE